MSREPKAKQASKQAKPSAKTRRLKAPRYRSFRLHKRIQHPVKLPGVFRLFGRSVLFLRVHWRVFGGIILVYGLLSILLVRGVGSGLDLSELKSIVQGSTQENAGQLFTGLTLFGFLVNSASTAEDPSTGIYQTILVVLMSLALIWALRQLQAGVKIGVRDAFYRGMYPLIPFILVLLVIGLQLLPLAIGSSLYGLVVANGIAVTAIEQLLWAVLFFMLALLSLYMVSSSIFALYIVTLPDMTPMKALRSARQLVLHRRWHVMRKVLFLPLAILVLAAVLIVPLILFVTPAAEAAFMLYSMVALAIAHSYLYALYRELL